MGSRIPGVDRYTTLSSEVNQTVCRKSRARHVIATLWSIYDTPAPEIADAVYATLTITGTPNANHAAHALHHATTAL